MIDELSTDGLNTWSSKGLSGRIRRMDRSALRMTFVAVMVFVGASLGRAQSPAPNFELSVATTPDRAVSIRCVRGCSLVVATLQPGGETQWQVRPTFAFAKCEATECSSGQVLGGVVSQSPSPDFDLWVANKIDGTVIRCVRGCKFAAVVGAPKSDDPLVTRLSEVRFPCSGQSCASGRIGGWIAP